jgi:hypothetical protein
MWPGDAMTTDLFVAGARVDADRVLSCIPPACRRPLDIPYASSAGHQAVELPVWTPRRASRHFLPALSVLADVEYSVRFELAVEQAGCWSPWTASATLGPHRFPTLATQHASLRSEVDVFFASDPAERVRMRIAVHCDAGPLLERVPWLATLSVSDLAQVPDSGDVIGGRAVIDVPACSQMEEPDTICHRICSPTSVAMVLGRWGVPAAPGALAADVFHEELDLYGVWPAAIRAGARRGIAGYLLRFPDWQAARWCLGAGLPVVASVRYARGDLSGAAIEETSGHLIVLTGFDGAEVLVNDPGAPTRAEVPRRYELHEIRRAWLERSGVGYVFFRP